MQRCGSRLVGEQASDINALLLLGCCFLLQQRSCDSKGAMYRASDVVQPMSKARKIQLAAQAWEAEVESHLGASSRPFALNSSPDFPRGVWDRSTGVLVTLSR